MEEILKLIENKKNKNCEMLKCKVVENNIKKNQEIIELKKQLKNSISVKKIEEKIEELKVEIKRNEKKEIIDIFYDCIDIRHQIGILQQLIKENTEGDEE